MELHHPSHLCLHWAQMKKIFVEKMFRIQLKQVNITNRSVLWSLISLLISISLLHAWKKHDQTNIYKRHPWNQWRESQNRLLTVSHNYQWIKCIFLQNTLDIFWWGLTVKFNCLSFSMTTKFDLHNDLFLLSEYFQHRYFIVFHFNVIM